MNGDWLVKNWKPISRILSFFLGVGVVIHEVFFADSAAPQTLGFAALLMGWVVAWRADEIRTTKKDEEKNGKP